MIDPPSFLLGCALGLVYVFYRETRRRARLALDRLGSLPLRRHDT